jgi:hypothetical protein
MFGTLVGGRMDTRDDGSLTVQRKGFGKVMAHPGFLSLFLGDCERDNVQFLPVLLRKFGRPDYK